MKEENSRSVEVVLMGQKFHFKTVQSDEHVKKVEELVNSEIQSLKNKKPSASPTDIVMLSAMRIADKYVQTIEEQRAQINGLLEKSDKLMAYIDARLQDRLADQ
jgi:cell division protein ZapA (FtsZ GTPase activity inhibitor)